MATVAIIVGLSIWIMGLRVDVANQKTTIVKMSGDISLLTANNGILKTNLTSAEEANKTNQSTIDSLVSERKQSQEAIQALNDKHRASLAYTATLQARIAELAKDPKNDGIVSPVLAEAIKSIEARRGAK